jgi:hypothetical protein
MKSLWPFLPIALFHLLTLSVPAPDQDEIGYIRYAQTSGHIPNAPEESRFFGTMGLAPVHRIIVKIFAQGLRSGRLPSVVCGLLGVLILYYQFPSPLVLFLSMDWVFFKTIHSVRPEGVGFLCSVVLFSWILRED